MNYISSSIIFPYELHVISGPMKSGKSKELFHLIDKFTYLKDIEVLAVKPNIDNRDFDSRIENISGIKLEKIDTKNPEIISKYFEDFFYNIVLIDECQFFSDKIIEQIDELLQKGVYVVCAGLDLDFRGEVFGPMGAILARADIVHKLGGVCEFEECNRKATRTQREIDGKPAHYNSPIIIVGDVEEGYSCRCLEHHYVIRDSLEKFITK